MSQAMEFVQEQINKHKVVVFSKTYCPFCRMAKEALKEAGAQFEAIELENRSDGHLIQQALMQLTGAQTVPRVFINKKCIGGGTETRELLISGELIKMLAS